jgi:hypothetical protein
MQSTSLQQQLHHILNGLKAAYLALVGSKLWAGVTASPHGSSFVVGTAKDDEIAQARAIAAMKNLTWDEWVKKYAKCHHCGEQGHICPNCPIYLDKIKSSKIKRGGMYASPRGLPKACHPGCPLQRRDFMKDPKAKAFSSAFQALFTTDEGVDDDNDALAKANNAAHDQDAEDNDLHGLLSMVGYLKEKAVVFLVSTPALSFIKSKHFYLSTLASSYMF